MHSTLKILALGDALYGNAPYLSLLKSLSVRYFINAKPGKHKWLFIWVNTSKSAEFTPKDKHNEQKFRFINQVTVNESNEALKVNFLECRQINAKKEEK